jgi:hypothetical protein
MWFESDCIKFYIDGTFEYKMWHCTGTNKGKGEYLIKNGKLKLVFNRKDSLINQSSIVLKKESTTESQENPIVKVQVFELLDSNKLQFASIYLTDTLLNDSIIRGITTDSLGIARLSLENSNLLTILFVGYEKVEIPIKNSINLNIKIFLAERRLINYLTEEDNMTFPIKKIKHNKFLLKRYKKMKYLNYEVEN